MRTCKLIIMLLSFYMIGCDQTPDGQFCGQQMLGPPPPIGVTRSALATPGGDPPPPADHDDYVPPEGVCLPNIAGGMRAIYGDARLHDGTTDCGADFVDACKGAPAETAGVSFFFHPPSKLEDGYCFFTLQGGVLGGVSAVSIQLNRGPLSTEQPYFSVATSQTGSEQVFLVTDGVHVGQQAKYQASDGSIAVFYRFDGSESTLVATDLRAVCLDPPAALRYAVEMGARLLF